MTYRFRRLRPKKTEWIVGEGTSLEDAIQEWHFHRAGNLFAEDSVGLLVPRGQDCFEQQWFALFEDENGERLISRICTSSLVRVSGVKRPGGSKVTTLTDVARRLGVELSRLEGEWTGEEDYGEVLT